MTCRAESGRQSGFTLLEILVVVGLMGLLMAILLPNVGVTEDRGLEQDAERVEQVLTLLGEQAVFGGELLGVRFEEERLVPMRFSPEDQRFVEIGLHERAGVGPLQLKGNTRLSWELEKGPDPRDLRADQAGLSLEQAASARLTQGERDDDARSRPQVFLFPSGEATPVTLRIEHLGDLQDYREVRLTSLGRAERVTDPLDGDASGPGRGGR